MPRLKADHGSHGRDWRYSMMRLHVDTPSGSGVLAGNLLMNMVAHPPPGGL
jgi:hypothetical protein